MRILNIEYSSVTFFMSVYSAFVTFNDISVIYRLHINMQADWGSWALKYRDPTPWTVQYSSVI